MSENPLIKVSVIIPMYNCEDFVNDMLASMSAQTLKDIEVICVIDGATDGTKDAVKKYCESDERFRYIVKINGGAGSARNTGIEAASGKYIIFCDVDDLYSKDYLTNLYNAAEALKADIAVCDFITIDYQTGEKRNIKSFNKTMLKEGEVYSTKKIKRLLRMISIQISASMYLLDFIKFEKLRFSETPASNDLFFTRASIVCAKRVTVVHDVLMTVRRHINKNSISSNRGKYSHIALDELQKFYKWLENRDILTTFINDYFWLFDVTANYEMKTGINPLFAEKMAQIISCDEPWKKLSPGQIVHILKCCLGTEGNEQVKVPEKNADAEQINNIKIANEVASDRNEKKRNMQQMVKKIFAEKYDNNFFLTDQESEYKKIFISETDFPTVNSIQKNENFETQNDPAITVIIPMYNCSSFAQNVLNMFSSQTFSDFEAICILDGSADRTEEIVKDYCEKDSRFIYIYQKNRGAGGARNTGIDIARGKYIVFSDADDWYCNEYLRKLYETADKYDAQIVISRFILYDYNSSIEEICGFDTEKFYENTVYSHNGIDDLFKSFESRVTNRIYNTEFIRSKGLRFPLTRISEDVFWGYAGLAVADRILVVHDILMEYRLNANSDSISSNRKLYLPAAVEGLRNLYKWLKNHSMLDVHGDDFLRRVNNTLLIYGSNEVTPEFIDEFAKFLNAEEPWDKMTSGEILSYLNEGLLAKKSAKKMAELKAKYDLKVIKNDKKLSFLFDYYGNIIHTAELIRKVSKERYGRDFEQNDSLPSSVLH